MLAGYRNEMPHDSSLYIFREPVGAYRRALRSRYVSARGRHVEGVFLCVYSDQFRENHSMALEDGFWQISFAALLSPTYSVSFRCQNGRKARLLRRGRQTHGGMGCSYTELPPAFS